MEFFEINNSHYRKNAIKKSDYLNFYNINIQQKINSVKQYLFEFINIGTNTIIFLYNAEKSSNTGIPVF